VNTKFLEVRDAGTFIAVLAVEISKRDGWLAWKSGFGEDLCIYLIALSTERCAYDPYSWPNRTLSVAHQFIEKEWEQISENDVIDVEFILGESSVKKPTEQGAR
jgi:hypothetical protein